MAARKATQTPENAAPKVLKPRPTKTNLGRGYASSEHWFKPGHGAGRPKGSRNKLGERFICALHDDFAVHGVGVIKRLREEEPGVYVRVIAALLPKQVEVDATAVSTLSDEDVVRLVAGIDRWLATNADDGAGVVVLPPVSEASDIS